MDFTLEPQHVALRRMLREFCEQELHPRAREVDRTGEQDPAILKWMGELGLFGIPFSQEYGGAGAGEMGYCILMEELNRVWPSTAAIVGARRVIAVHPNPSAPIFTVADVCIVAEPKERLPRVLAALA
jgi:alkylation response protein AidB-like acyl-CoA dehydrogenase